MNKILFICLVVSLVFSTGCTQELPVEPPKPILSDNPKASALDKLVDNIFNVYASRPKTAGFSIALINDTQVYSYNYGETKLGNQTLPNNQTLYEIGSITKTFIASTLVSWLDGDDINSPISNLSQSTAAQLGLDINSPISIFLPPILSPHLGLNNTPITFKHLLSHTSGFPRIPNDLPDNLDPYDGYDSAKVYNYITQNNLLRTPGTLPTSEQQAYNFYSNFAYGLAGILLERIHNQNLNTVLRNYIFDELGMTNTTFNNIESVSNRAYPHNHTNNASYWHFSGLAGAGGLKSCLSDMIKYAQAQINAANFSAIQKCQEPVVQINGKSYFGLGWEFYYTKSNKRITVKDGGTGGFTAFIAFDRTSKKAVVALFNNSNDNNPAEPFVNLLEEFFK